MAEMTPDQVKEFLVGGAAPDDQGMDKLMSDVLGLPNVIKVDVEELDGVLFVNFPHTAEVFTGPLRCPTCGRASTCACGDDCSYCVLGTPNINKMEAKG